MQYFVHRDEFSPGSSSSTYFLLDKDLTFMHEDLKVYVKQASHPQYYFVNTFLCSFITLSMEAFVKRELIGKFRICTK